MPLTTVVIMIDGLDPEYLDWCPMPNIRQLARQGFIVEGKGMMPSVTNVNNVSLVTAGYPDTHGITTNYWLNREDNREYYMESGDFIESETMFQRATRQGARSLLVTAKDKLRRLLGDGVTLGVSSEQPPQWVVDAVGEPPHIYSLEVNEWVINTGRYILSQEHYDLVYLTTTDYAMHTYAPQETESARHLDLLDQAIGRLVDSLPEVLVLLTADHGMSSKSRMIHLPQVLAQHGVQAQAVPIIKDMYTVHHSNLEGVFTFTWPKPTAKRHWLRCARPMGGRSADPGGSSGKISSEIRPDRRHSSLGSPRRSVWKPTGSQSASNIAVPRLPARGPGADYRLRRQLRRIRVQGKQGRGAVRL